MLQSITFFKFLGMPLIMWGGIVVFLLFLAAAFAAIAPKKGWAKIDVKWHMRLAGIAILLGLVHGVMGILSLF